MKSKVSYAVAAVLSLALISTAVITKRSNEIEVVYMNKTGAVVGGQTYHCAGGVSEWGTVTQYSEKYVTPCN